MGKARNCLANTTLWLSLTGQYRAPLINFRVDSDRGFRRRLAVARLTHRRLTLGIDRICLFRRRAKTQKLRVKIKIRKVSPRSPFSFLSSLVGEVVEEVFETNWDLEVDKFDNMGLNEKVLRGIYGYGFKDPSPI